LGQHSLSGLHEDIDLRVCHHLLDDIYVANGALGILDVFLGYGQVIDDVVEAVLEGTQAAAHVGRTGLVRDVDIVNPYMPTSCIFFTKMVNLL